MEILWNFNCVFIPITKTVTKSDRDILDHSVFFMSIHGVQVTSILDRKKGICEYLEDEAYLN